MKPECVLGIDPSTHTGIVALALTTEEVLHQSEIDVSSYARYPRWNVLRDSLASVFDAYSVQLIVIEGYGYGNAHNLATLVELGTVVRWAAFESHSPFLEIPPSSLKSYVCGIGNAKKQVMLKEAYKLWQFDCNNDNIVDAFCLAKLGQDVLNPSKTLPKHRQKVIQNAMKNVFRKV